jgi:hypothetical protein
MLIYSYKHQIRLHSLMETIYINIRITNRELVVLRIRWSTPCPRLALLILVPCSLLIHLLHPGLSLTWGLSPARELARLDRYPLQVHLVPRCARLLSCQYQCVGLPACDCNQWLVRIERLAEKNKWRYLLATISFCLCSSSLTRASSL